MASPNPPPPPGAGGPRMPPPPRGGKNNMLLWIGLGAVAAGTSPITTIPQLSVPFVPRASRGNTQ